MDRLARVDHEIGGIERDPEYLRGAKTDGVERALHAVVAHQDEDEPVRLVHFGDRATEPTVGRRLIKDGEVATRLAHVFDLHLDGDRADVRERERDHTCKRRAHHERDLERSAILNHGHD